LIAVEYSVLARSDRRPLSAGDDLPLARTIRNTLPTIILFFVSLSQSDADLKSHLTAILHAKPFRALITLTRH
jgi:hypothetical protein